MRDTVAPLARGDAVVRAAILLDRLKFSPGQISSGYTVNFGKAVQAFQAARGLTTSGMVDAATWNALNNDNHTNRDTGAAAASSQQSGQNGADQAQMQPQQNSAGQQNGAPQTPPVNAIVPYIVAMEDVAGPFRIIPHASSSEALMLREAKLKQLNYSSALDLLAEKFHASPRLLVELNPRKSFRKAGEEIRVPNVLTPEPPEAARIVVDGATKSVTAYDANGKLLAVYPATIGSEHDPLPAGDWAVADIEWYPKFKYNPKLFWDSGDKNPRATVPAGPRGPVGVVWIGLTTEHYGIHGTATPASIGRVESHGCIRLTNWDATELAKSVHKGTPVKLQNGAPTS